MLERLSSESDFELALKNDEKVLVFKHSATCPVSQTAYEEYEAFIKANESFKTYYLVVQEDRPLSNHIAETFHVKHESPQALLFKNGDVIWHDSHWRITADSLKAAIAEN